MDLQARGRFGNRLLTFPTASAALGCDSEYFTIRSEVRDSPFFVPVVHRADLEAKAKELLGRGAEQLYYQQIPHPESSRLMNGEAALLDCGLILKHGAMPTRENLRDDLSNNGTHVDLARASAILRAALQEENGDLWEILEAYEDHVVEFTVFSRACGLLKRRLIVWEVRCY